jgi:hypothetical protein
VAAEIPVQPILAEVDGIDLADGRWRLTARTPAGERLDLDCDGLVVTGPGTPIRLPGQPDSHPRILDGRSFWAREDALADTGPVEVCVIGNGETAGSVTTALLGLLPEGSVVELVSDHGVLYTRGESFAENRFYSDPDAAGWQQLAERHRREFLKRTDRGVFSVQVQEVLNRTEAVRPLAGRVIRLEPVEAKVIVEVEHEQAREGLALDWVVVAVGFDPLWFVPLLGERARAALADAAGGDPTGCRRPPRWSAPSVTTSPSPGLLPSSTCRFWPASPRGPGSPTCPALACSPTACSAPTPARRAASSFLRPTRPPPPAVRDDRQVASRYRIPGCDEPGGSEVAPSEAR